MDVIATGQQLKFEYDGFGMRRKAEVYSQPTTGPPTLTETRSWVWDFKER